MRRVPHGRLPLLPIVARGPGHVPGSRRGAREARRAVDLRRARLRSVRAARSNDGTSGADPTRVPAFDHEGDPEDAIAIYLSHKVILVEGNYLLLTDEPWRELWDGAGALLDERWFVATTVNTVRGAGDAAARGGGSDAGGGKGEGGRERQAERGAGVGQQGQRGRHRALVRVGGRADVSRPFSGLEIFSMSLRLMTLRLLTRIAQSLRVRM